MVFRNTLVAAKTGSGVVVQIRASVHFGKEQADGCLERGLISSHLLPSP
jgi:hypothetical protein